MGNLMLRLPSTKAFVILVIVFLSVLILILTFWMFMSEEMKGAVIKEREQVEQVKTGR